MFPHFSDDPAEVGLGRGVDLHVDLSAHVAARQQELLKDEHKDNGRFIAPVLTTLGINRFRVCTSRESDSNKNMRKEMDGVDRFFVKCMDVE